MMPEQVMCYVVSFCLFVAGVLVLFVPDKKKCCNNTQSCCCSKHIEPHNCGTVADDDCGEKLVDEQMK